MSEDVAVDELLDAAGRTFAEIGVGKATMVDVCRTAGCSRATLYRYFESRSALHLAFVNRAALRIARSLGESRGPTPLDTPEVLTERILAGIEAVRSDPLLEVWFEPENLAVPVALSRDSEVLAALAGGFVDGLEHGFETGFSAEQIELRGGWLLRCIVALLAMPGVDAEAERAMVRSFLVPVLLAETGAALPQEGGSAPRNQEPR